MSRVQRPALRSELFFYNEQQAFQLNGVLPESCTLALRIHRRRIVAEPNNRTRESYESVVNASVKLITDGSKDEKYPKPRIHGSETYNKQPDDGREAGHQAFRLCKRPSEEGRVKRQLYIPSLPHFLNAARQIRRL